MRTPGIPDWICPVFYLPDDAFQSKQKTPFVRVFFDMDNLNFLLLAGVNSSFFQFPLRDLREGRLIQFLTGEIIITP